ncbi:MAG: glutamine--fructose-6-phosphate transaminase (isomerizing) [Thiohalorhabdus sp.]|uniref:glutamine--fructose-6-phosphate transaminase (isomerizing) n=1 Tax=Thiohalorhabdus sp. TaxID=3094134 RepID=UPI00397F415D
MCGIIGGVGERNMVPVLLEGLSRLEYRGYDSAGLVVLGGGGMTRRRREGKVSALEEEVEAEGIRGHTGIAHTRWATHGSPSAENAHPHVAGDRVAVVHNGIIENHGELRAELEAEGYVLTSQTDTETIPCLIHRELTRGSDLFGALREVARRLQGAYALAVVDAEDPGRIVGARKGSPLLLGVGVGEHFLASDAAALVPVTQELVDLADGDFVELTRDGFTVTDLDGHPQHREVRTSHIRVDQVERGQYRHFMQKEIFEQPSAVAETLEGRIERPDWGLDDIADGLADTWSGVEEVLILACGTSYHAAQVARYWMEAHAGLPTAVEVASEFRYRDPVVRPGTAIIAISQSGETADTLAAVRELRRHGHGPVLAICNVRESSLDREADTTLYTEAGPEIGVASTKAFTTQLTVLALLTAAASQSSRGAAWQDPAVWREELRALPRRIHGALELDESMRRVAAGLLGREHALFLGRGPFYPIAMEGALKLKEISYIHAESYPAGELKHGPLALVDEDMPVFVLAPNNQLLDKVLSNLEEVRTRGGDVVVLTEPGQGPASGEGLEVVELPDPGALLAPVLYTIPLQLLAYHTAVLKGTDVDQPRNLAKSVTVE